MSDRDMLAAWMLARDLQYPVGGSTAELLDALGHQVGIALRALSAGYLRLPPVGPVREPKPQREQIDVVKV